MPLDVSSGTYMTKIIWEVVVVGKEPYSARVIRNPGSHDRRAEQARVGSQPVAMSRSSRRSCIGLSLAPVVRPSMGSAGDTGACPRAGVAGPWGQCHVRELLGHARV